MSADREPQIHPRLAPLVSNVERVLFGRPHAIRLAVTALLADGHLLLEDAPGTGKTTLARALAKSLDLQFRRVQCTPDLLPSDLVGVSVLDAARGEFVLKPGPVFTHVLLADELNRTIPRTQSALLECMAERRVSVDGKTHALPRPFFVLATQNPLEFEGTYPLPESQLDRFLIRTAIGYPDREDERRALRSPEGSEAVEALSPALSPRDLESLQEEVRRVRVDAAIEDYVLSLLESTRRGGQFVAGLSTRAGMGLVRASQAWALLAGRDYVLPDDVKRLAVPVLAHRLVGAGHDGERADGSRAILELLERTNVPR